MFKRSAQLLGVMLAFSQAPAFALGLGEISVDSYLNQPLKASIAISTATKAELESLKVAIASAQDFKREGLDRSDYLLSLKFNVVQDGKPRVEISSQEIAREPFLNFVVEAWWGGGRLQREYTVLLDPPEMAKAAALAAKQAAEAPASSQPSVQVYQPAPRPVTQATPVMPKPVTSEVPAPKPAAPKPVAPKPAVSSPAKPVPAAPAEPRFFEVPAATRPVGSFYGPIAPKETLWSIAAKLRPDPDRVTMSQMLLALYEASPESFQGGLGGLQKGSLLRIPSLSTILAVEPEDAALRVAKLRASERPATTVASRERVETAPKPTPKPKPIQQDERPATIAAPAAKAESFDAVPDRVAAPESPAVPADKELVAATKAAAAKAMADDAAESPAADTKPVMPAKPAEAAGSALSRLQAMAGRESAGGDDASAPTAAGGDTQNPAAESAMVEDDMGVELAEADVNDEAYYDELEAEPESVELDEAGLEVETEAEAEPADANAGGANAPAPVRSEIPGPDGPGLPWGLIGGGLVLLLGGAGGFAYMRKRKQGMAVATAASAAAAASASLAADAESVEEVDEDSPALGNTADLAADAASSEADTPAPEGDQDGGVAPDDSAMAETSTADVTDEAHTPVAPGDEVDFDVTAQFATDTMQINLDSNDPVSEADFHLAYGLYDEAAMLLKGALDTEPQRQDIKIKLAETYFAGGNAEEFVGTARDLKAELSVSEWQKIAIMGQQIAPGESLFEGDLGDTEIASTDMDLDFSADEPESLPEVEATPEPAAADEPLELDLDIDSEAEADKAVEEPAAADAGAEANDESALEFDLGDFDLDDEDSIEEPKPEPASEATPEAAEEPEATEESEPEGADLSEFDLGGFDDEPEPTADAPVVEPEAAEAPSATDSDADDAALDDFAIDLDGEESPAEDAEGEAETDSTTYLSSVSVDAIGESLSDSDDAEAEAEDETFDLSELSIDEDEDSNEISGGDEASTKLDLARAYIDMGDSEMARSLLDEVAASGNEKQKAEAGELLGRLA